MLLVLLVNGVIWSVIVKYYYESKTADRTLSIVLEEVQSLSPLISKAVDGERVQLAAFLSDSMQDNEMPFLEVYKAEDGVVFSKGASMLPERYTQHYGQLPEEDAPVYQLFESDNNHYLYLFAQVFKSGWYMRAAIPVSPRIMEQIHDNTSTALLVAIVTLVQVALVLLPLMMTSYRRIVKDNERVLMSHLSMVQALGNAIAKRDSDTDSHNYRVSYYALRLAEAVGLERRAIPGLLKGSFLHDVGKIGVPDSILLKPTRLNKEEIDIIQKHVADGLEIVTGIPWLYDAKSVISGHHENYDGSGYPHGLGGNAIPVEARIFSVVDVFDALTSRRPYKEPLSVEETLCIMDDVAGQHFDPGIYHVFREMAIQLHKQMYSDDRRKLRRILSHAIQPYFSLMYK